MNSRLIRRRKLGHFGIGRRLERRDHRRRENRRDNLRDEVPREFRRNQRTSLLIQWQIAFDVDANFRG